MGDNFNGKLKIGNNDNNYLTPTLMNYFNGNEITHIEIGYKFGVIVTKELSLRFQIQMKNMISSHKLKDVKLIW